MFLRNVAQPFRFTLGGPLRLCASAIDEYRGTDYFLVEPAFLRPRPVARPLGQSNLRRRRLRGWPDASARPAHRYSPGLLLRRGGRNSFGIITFAPAFGDDLIAVGLYPWQTILNQRLVLHSNWRRRS